MEQKQENKQKPHINPYTEKPFKFQPKPEFEARMNKLLEDENDRKAYWEIIHKEAIDSIRCNTLKINPKELKKKLEEKGYHVEYIE